MLYLYKNPKSKIYICFFVNRIYQFAIIILRNIIRINRREYLLNELIDDYYYGNLVNLTHSNESITNAATIYRRRDSAPQ